MNTLLKLSFADYERMIAAGSFDPLGDRRIELIYGELREMTPPGPTHAEMVSRLNRWSIKNTDERVVSVRVQDPIGIPEFASGPQPDVVWAKAKNYAKRYPRPADVLLLIEVALSSLDNDLTEKAEIYARSRIADYWVVNLEDFCVEVFRRPGSKGYRDRQAYQVGEDIHPLAFPKVELSVGPLFAGVD